MALERSQPWTALSVLAAVLAVGTSLAGIFMRDTYARETSAWAVQAIGQDWANLAVAVVLTASALRLRRGSARARLIWLGCLLYFLYAFVIYAFAVQFNRLFLAYVAILGLSFYALAGSLATLDLTETLAPLADHRRRNGAGTLLIGTGVLFAVLWLAQILPHLASATRPPGLVETGLRTNPVHVLDLALFLPAMILIGVLLRRRNRWGLLFAVPLLVFAVTMGAGILAMFAVSAAQGLPVPAPPVLLVSVIMAASGTYAWQLLGALPEHE